MSKKTISLLFLLLLGLVLFIILIKQQTSGSFVEKTRALLLKQDPSLLITKKGENGLSVTRSIPFDFTNLCDASGTSIGQEKEYYPINFDVYNFHGSLSETVASQWRLTDPEAISRIVKSLESNKMENFFGYPAYTRDGTLEGCGAQYIYVLIKENTYLVFVDHLSNQQLSTDDRMKLNETLKFKNYINQVNLLENILKNLKEITEPIE